MLARPAKCGWLAVALLTAVSVENAAAQKGAARYTPTRPTTSPYLNLLRDNERAFLNYQTLVRPQLEQNRLNEQQRAINQRQSAQLNRQEIQLDRVASEFAQSEAAPTGTSSWFFQPSTRNAIRDTSHFYEMRRERKPQRR